MTVETKQARLRKNLDKKIQAKTNEIEIARKELAALQREHDKKAAALDRAGKERRRRNDEWRANRTFMRKLIGFFWYDSTKPSFGEELIHGFEGVLVNTTGLALLTAAEKEIERLEEELDGLEREYADLLADESAAASSAETDDDVIAQIKALHQKMNEAIANESDPALRRDIQRIYGKKLDRLRERL